MLHFSVPSVVLHMCNGMQEVQVYGDNPPPLELLADYIEGVHNIGHWMRMGHVLESLSSSMNHSKQDPPPITQVHLTVWFCLLQRRPGSVKIGMYSLACVRRM